MVWMPSDISTHFESISVIFLFWKLLLASSLAVRGDWSFKKTWDSFGVAPHAINFTITSFVPLQITRQTQYRFNPLTAGVAYIRGLHFFISTLSTTF